MDVIANKITLVGNLDNLTFSHKHGNETFYKGFITVKRESGVADVVPVMVSGFLSPVRGRVKIEGQVRSRSYEQGGKNRLDVFVFVIDMEPTTIDEDVNQAIVDGFICSKKELRYTPKGRVILDLMLACNHQVYNKSYYIPLVIWGRQAKGVASDYGVGTKVRVIGRFQSREYVKVIDETTQETRMAYELSVMHIEEV